MIITQCFKTIQGEGPSLGLPVLLIRFFGCNLTCPWCDSKWTNDDNYIESKQISAIDSHYKPDNILNCDYIQLGNYITDNNLNTVKRVMITGGEPFLYFDFITRFKSLGLFCEYEIESNGTLIHENLRELSSHKNIQINISPKLDLLSYSKYGNITFDKILNAYINLHNNLNKFDINYNFKFVYSEKYETAIKEFIIKTNINREKLNIMALMPNIESKDFQSTYLKSCHDTIKFCSHYNLRYTPREHIFLFSTDKNEGLL